MKDVQAANAYLCRPKRKTKQKKSFEKGCTKHYNVETDERAALTAKDSNNFDTEQERKLVNWEKVLNLRR